ncbi:hypothetical protein TNCV_2780271 [Trichonephila clavipes]|nr:hypothetical protein TNCV_2780271 [Trichonephila clavipes]
MFSVPTPISPLPPTPIASPSHEASEDVIYDALPPWSNLPFRITFEGFHGTIYRFRITFERTRGPIYRFRITFERTHCF